MRPSAEPISAPPELQASCREFSRGSTVKTAAPSEFETPELVTHRVAV